MVRERESIQIVGRVASLVLVGAAFCCLVALLYTFYYYSWTRERSFTSNLGPWLFYVLPGTLAGLLLSALRLQLSSRIKLALLLVSTAVPVYGFETALVLTSVDPRVLVAREFGVELDTRSKLDVVKDLERQQIRAAPNIFPRSLLKKQADGPVRSVLSVNGAETLPLGGIANRTTVFCNENGQYVIYQSDDHGFHNPGSLWNNPVDIATIGDSFTEGFCVDSDKGFVALVRNRHPGTLNLGKTGDGPLTELATLTE